MKPLALAAALLVLVLAAPASHAARTATVGPGFAAGIAVAPDGTAYAGWKTGLGENEGPFVRLCALARDATGCTTPPAEVPIPEPYNLGDVGVFTPAPGVVEVVAGSGTANDRAGAYLSRSTDGGRSFAPAAQLVRTQYPQRFERLPDGRFGVGGGLLGLSGAVAPADGSTAGQEVVGLSEQSKGVIAADVAGTPDGATVVAGSDGTFSEAFLLAPGANPFDRANWAGLPRQLGTTIHLAGGSAGFFSVLRPKSNGRHFVQRLQGLAWQPPVFVGGDATDLDLTQDAAGRVHVFAADSDEREEIAYARSDDGGALFSASTRLAPVQRTISQLSSAVGPDGRGAAIEASDAPDDEPIRVAWLDPARVPASTIRVGDAFVQVRSRCARRREVTLEARASRGGRRVAVGTVLRSARYSSRSGRTRRTRRYATRLRLRSDIATATVRATLRPRSGAPVRTAFRAVGCRGAQ